MLAACSNQVLAQLDDCKANDLACECCALQSMDPKCHNLCPGNPSANFLSVLVNDCAPLNDINACNLPFKKTDGDGRPQKVMVTEPDNTILVKSQLLKPGKVMQSSKGNTVYSMYSESDLDTEEDLFESDDDSETPWNATTRPVLTLIRNHSNVTGMYLLKLALQSILTSSFVWCICHGTPIVINGLRFVPLGLGSVHRDIMVLISLRVFRRPSQACA